MEQRKVDMTSFNGKLSALCTAALQEARGNPDMQAEMVERLVNATAFTIAAICQGQKKPMDTMLAGVEQQLYESAAEHKDTALFMAKIGRA